jgi:hypothetical protein
MIKEAYCSFEVAELLKEKGFNEPCYTCYINKELSHYDYLSTNFELIDNVISAPTHQMAMKWLREKHIHIIIDYREVSYKYFFRISYCYNSSENLDFYYSYEDAVEAAIKYCLEYLI